MIRSIVGDCSYSKGRHDTQHNDIQHNDTQLKDYFFDTQFKRHSVSSDIILSVAFFYRLAECHHAECRYVECRFGECRGALKTQTNGNEKKGETINKQK